MAPYLVGHDIVTAPRHDIVAMWFTGGSEVRGEVSRRCEVCKGDIGHFVMPEGCGCFYCGRACAYLDVGAGDFMCNWCGGLFSEQSTALVTRVCLSRYFYISVFMKIPKRN